MFKKYYVILFILSFSHTVFGKIEYRTFFSNALQQDRNISLYFPEGYSVDANIRYPVIYFLHGAFCNHTTDISSLAAVLDEKIQLNQIHPFLLVIPDGYSCPSQWLGGSFWTNSVLNGLFEDYVAYDLVSFMDATFPTKNSPENRVMMGFSDGGDGAMVTGLKHPEIYRTIVVNAGFFNWDLVKGTFRNGLLKEYTSKPYIYTPGAGTYSRDLFRVATAYSPNMSKAPFFVDFPFDENGEAIEAVFSRWKQNNTDVLISALPRQNIPNIYFTCGTGDVYNYEGNIWLKNYLKSQNIPFTYVEFYQGHALYPAQIEQMLSYADQKVTEMTSVRVEDMISVPQFQLCHNYPNPFNPTTTIDYQLPSRIDVTIQIFNLKGGLVKTLINKIEAAGDRSVQWDATDDLGRNVPVGVYLCCIKAGQYTKTIQMLLLK